MWNRLFNESKFILGAFFISTILILNPLAAYASYDVGATDGLHSPAECMGTPVKDDSPTTTSTGTAPPGFKISGVCIKTGTGGAGDPFPDNPIGTSHSLVISSSPVTVGDSCVVSMGSCSSVTPDVCYDVTDIGMTTATVTATGVAGCKALSHVDYLIMTAGLPPSGIPPASTPVGGDFIGVDTTALLIAGAQMNAFWILPVVIAAAGLGIVLSRKFN